MTYIFIYNLNNSQGFGFIERILAHGFFNPLKINIAVFMHVTHFLPLFLTIRNQDHVLNLRY